MKEVVLLLKNGGVPYELLGPTKEFPNGFQSWMETFYEIVEYISLRIHDDLDNPCMPIFIKDRYEAQGTVGMYELAEKLTDEFEKLNEGRDWDGEFFDEIMKFIYEKNK